MKEILSYIKVNGLCAKEGDIEDFMPRIGTNNDKEAKEESEAREARAKDICGRCAVREECLEYALAANERFGIWGGMSERERRRIKRQSF